jgi:hypothetical protein
MNPTRLSTPSAEVQSQRPSFWEPARLLLASLGGLLALAICSSFLGEYDSGRFAEFLKGQVGFDGMLSCALFWKMAIAFALGTVAGYFISLEIPSAHYKKFNLLALGAALFLIPVVVYIPAMSAGFLWDDDQEISGNPSLLQVPVDPNQLVWAVGNLDGRDHQRPGRKRGPRPGQDGRRAALGLDLTAAAARL